MEVQLHFHAIASPQAQVKGVFTVPIGVSRAAGLLAVSFEPTELWRIY